MDQEMGNQAEQRAARRLLSRLRKKMPALRHPGNRSAAQRE